MKNKNIIIAVIITAVIAGGLGFWGGKATNGSTTPTPGTGQFTRGAGFAGRGGAGGAATMGSIVSTSGNSLTLSMRDGSSKVVFFSASTTIMKTSAGSVSDLASGSTIVVSGTTNSDGSITATSIQLRPAAATPSAQ